MKFSTRIDREITAREFFDVLSDFDRIERMLLRRGMTVVRDDSSVDAATAWDLTFDWRGQSRDINLVLVQFDRPEKLAFKGKSKPFDLRIDLTVIALSRHKSRVIFELDARPRNMRARLAVQTAKLGKAQLDRKFARKVADFVDAATQR